MTVTILLELTITMRTEGVCFTIGRVSRDIKLGIAGRTQKPMTREPPT